MSKLREAAQAALEAWENTGDTEILWEMSQLRAALAEQEAEPVAWVYHLEKQLLLDGYLTWLRWTPERAAGWIETPLYAHPPRREWVGLTDQDIEQVLAAADRNSAQYRRTPGWAHLITATEAALKEKNHG